MSLKLYEINDEIDAIDKAIDVYASEHDGEIPDSLTDELDSLKGERVEKLLNLAVWHKSLIAEANAFKDELKRLQARQKALNSKADRIKGYIDSNMTDREKLSDTRSVLSYRKSTQVIIDKPVEELPGEVVTKTTVPNKTEIKDWLRIHADCDFAHLQENHSLQIK